MDVDIAQTLTQWVFPALQLREVQALRGTCQALRSAVVQAEPGLWQKLARKSLPEDHPLCTCHSTTVLQRADQLALLHANLSAGKVTDISYALPSSDPQSRLGATLNSQGTLMISEQGKKLCVHQLLPDAQLREIASLPWPGQEATSAKADDEAEAFWASDDSAVVIWHEVCGDEGDHEGDDESDDENDWESDITPAMQAVYLLHVASLSIKHIIPETHDKDVQGVSFLPDNRHVLVRSHQAMWARYEVYDGQGKEVVHFGHEMPFESITWAFATKTKLAVACGDHVKVFDLTSGKPVGTLEPDILEDRTSEPAEQTGIVASNRAHSKLAFVAPGTWVVRIYDAATLSELACVRPLHAMRSDRATLERMVFGMSGWLFTNYQPFEKVHERLRVCVMASDHSTYREVLDHGHVGPGDPVWSPDGLFVGCYERATSRVKVFSVRLQQMVLTHKVVVPNDLKGSHKDMSRRIDLLWSACGSRLLVHTTIKHIQIHTQSFKTRSLAAASHILLLQFVPS